MSIIRRLLPQPLVSLAIMLLWLILTLPLSAGSLVLALALGLLIPLLTARFWPDAPRPRRLLSVIHLATRVLVDIVVANFVVARQVLGPEDALQPATITLPLDVTDPFVATVLGNIISLTPGTVTIDIDMEAKTALIHALHAPYPDALIADIKTRYEQKLLEIFP